MASGEVEQDNDATMDELSAEGRRLFAGVQHSLFGRSTEAGLGRFVLLDVLGRGGMSVVYRAYDPKLDRRVAVKVMASTDEAAQARMLREAQLLAQLSHPNVVTIHEVGEDRDDVFVAMEFVDGGTLGAFCEAHAGGGRERDRRLLALCHQAIDGLSAAHALGIVHRDIKPANLLVGADGRLRVADFGLARSGSSAAEPSVQADHDGSGSIDLTATGAVVGTPAYMPPEQYRGKADARSDQFSFCASFFEAWCGVRPYGGNDSAALLEAVEAGHMVDPPRPIPAFVLAVLRRGLQARPRDRFASMQALGQALRRGQQRRRRLAVGLGGLVLAGGIAAAVVPSPVAPCTDDRERVEQVMSPARREAIASALQDSGVPFIEEVATRADAVLDRIAGRWAAQRLEGCQQARSSTPEQAERGRMTIACLDQALERLDESLGRIEPISPEAARGFPDFLGVLSDLTDCREPQAEALGDDFGREMLATLQRGELADAAFERARARQAYEEVLARTEAGQLPRLRARAHYSISVLDDGNEQPEPAGRHAVASLDEAQAADDPESIARAWFNLANLQSHDMPWETVDLMLSRARRLDRVGELSAEVSARLGLVDANIRMRHDQPTEAARILRAAIAEAEPIGHPKLGSMYLQLAYVDMMEGDLDAGLTNAQRALELAEERYGPNHPQAAVARYRMANIQAFRGEIEQAERTIDPAIELLARTPDYRPTNLVKFYSMRGDIRRNLGRFEGAARDYQRAIELARKTGGERNPELSTLFASIAESYALQERYADALVAADTAIGLFDGASMQDRGGHATTLVLRAGVLADLGRRAEAAEQLEEASAAVRNAFPSGSISRIQDTYGMALVCLDIDEPTRALTMVAEYLDGETEVESLWKGRLQAIRARAFEALGDDAEAARWAREALEGLGPTDVPKDRTAMRELLARVEGGVATVPEP